MHLSAKADYAVRAAVQLAGSPDQPVKGDAIAQAQDIPLPFLGSILRDLREAGIVNSQRGADGYWLARPPGGISVAEVIWAVDGPLAWVRGVRPEDLEYAGPARSLREVWIAARPACARCWRWSRSPTWPAGRCPHPYGRVTPSPRPGNRTSRAADPVGARAGGPSAG